MITVKRLDIHLYPDPKRVIARFFYNGACRTKNVIDKILNMKDDEVHLVLGQVLADFAGRHRKITKIFETHYVRAIDILREELDYKFNTPSKEKQLLAGAYFTMEYSIESAAFFNPSIVEDPNQEDLEDGHKRVIISFRATGEGHISSLVFRSAILTKDNDIVFKPLISLVELPEKIKNHVYHKKTFMNRIKSLLIERREDGRSSAMNAEIEKIMNVLGNSFIYNELSASINKYKEGIHLSYPQKHVLDVIERAANAHYEMRFSMDTALQERVIFPFSFSEDKGIEDARFVKFIDEHDATVYYSTFTAYSSHGILPKFLSTKDFLHFKVMPIGGEYAKNKGMAIFPRKINGKFALLARIDGMSIYVMFSDNINVWAEEPKKIQQPELPWELIQIGNCGSPLETSKGWLVVTHGVGPMRRYCLSAILLDKNDPSRLIGKMNEPIIIPNDNEREGYVPNAIYSCGSIINKGELIIPYSMSDYASAFAVVKLMDIFNKMQLKK